MQDLQDIKSHVSAGRLDKAFDVIDSSADSINKRNKILKVAEKLIQLSGKRPYKDIPIVFTGPREGEKLSEELFCDQEVRYPTSNPNIWLCKAGECGYDWINHKIDILFDLIIKKDEKGFLEALRDIVPDCRCRALPRPCQ